MTDEERPRAQYGEYATPEEQHRARGLTGTPSEAAHQHPAPAVPAAVAHADAKPGHPVDRVVTMILLAIGLLLTLNSIPGYLSMPDVMQGVYDQLGAGTYPAGETAAALGVAALVVQGVLWLITATLSALSMRRGRLSWWIPVVGGALAFIASMVIVSAALFADPGFIDNVAPSSLPQP